MHPLGSLGWKPSNISGGLGIHTINLFTILSGVMEVVVYVPDLPQLSDRYPFGVTKVNIGELGSPYSTSGDFYDMVLEYNARLVENFEH